MATHGRVLIMKFETAVKSEFCPGLDGEIALAVADQKTSGSRHFRSRGL